MPAIVLDAKELHELARDMKGSDERMRAHARKAVRKVALSTEKRVKQEMPVDTGRARASWGRWSGGTNNPEASEADSIWRTEDDGLTNVQGSNVPYIGALNDGHSQKAPAGFIDAAAEVAAEVLNEELAKIDPLRFDAAAEFGVEVTD